MNTDETIGSNLDHIEDMICEACHRFGRKRDDILLLPVSKNQDVEKIKIVYGHGYRDFGENRVQELLSKVDVLPGDIRWHLIGSLQTNKVKYIVDKVSLIHSLDRLSLAEEIDRRSKQLGMTAECLVQVNISGEPSKSGIDPDKLGDFLFSLEKFENLKILGLMTIGLFTNDKTLIRRQFQRMESIFVDTPCKKMHNINMKFLSMGMSNDFVEAVEFGANILRIGTSIFGSR